MDKLQFLVGLLICIRRVFMYYVGLFVLSAVVFRMFFSCFKMFVVGLATVDIVLLID